LLLKTGLAKLLTSSRIEKVAEAKRS